MKKAVPIFFAIFGICFFVGFFFSGTYNGLVRAEENVKTAWSQVENVYQRRLDLIPNLVETVKGYAAHEKSTLTELTAARSRAAGTLSPDALSDPDKFSQFQASQAALSTSLGRLLAVVENYPDLKASQNFLSLQAQLEGTENRITVERGRFNEAAQLFNTKLRQFPTNLFGGFMGFRAKEYFKADAAAAAAPKVQF